MTRYFPDDGAVEHIALGMIDATLPKADWTHAAHFAAVLWLLRHRPDPPVEGEMPVFIRRYNEATGVENSDMSGYHETITIASIAAARAFLAAQAPERPLHELVDLLMETSLGDSKWPLAHWSRDRLFSPEARRRWVEPDLSPLAWSRGR